MASTNFSSGYLSEEDGYLISSREIRPSAKPKSYSTYAWGTSKKKKHIPSYFETISKRKQLPIWEYKEQIVKLIRESQVVIFDGETGSGKSTQIPQWCLGIYGVEYVVCIQPRRIAAISLAQRVAKEMGVVLGEEVGYAVRFDHFAGPKTVLKYVTDGILLRHAITDRMLSGYDIIILDEVHERRVISDILLGVVKDLLVVRPDVRVVVMSATLNVKQFCDYFDDCPHMHIPGKIYPIDISYEPKVIPRGLFTPFDKSRFQPFVFDAINVVMDICVMEKREGDILVFVTGRDEIDFICRTIDDMREDYIDSMSAVEVIPLYADLPYSSQQRIFAPSPKSSIGCIGRKCIIATNIAETSITIEGVVFVVDSGKVKLSNLVGTHLKSLLPVDISQSSAQQRAGRAGRTKPGKCYRLYSESSYSKLDKCTVPEILRCDLSSVFLHLKAIGVDLTRFEAIDQPTPDALDQAINKLQQLGALNSRCDVTAIGAKMSKFPLDAEIARMLVASWDYRCQQDIVTLASVLSGDRPGGVFIIEKEEKIKAELAKASLSHPSGDHLTYINVYNTFMHSINKPEWCFDNFINYQLMMDAISIREQLTQTMYDLYLMRPQRGRYRTEAANTENILKAVLTGIPGNIAKNDPTKMNRGKQRYSTFKDNLKVTLHPSSTLDSKSNAYPLLCYNTCLQTKPRQNFICVVSSVEEEWLYNSIAAPVFIPRSLQTPKIEPPYVSRYKMV